MFFAMLIVFESSLGTVTSPIDGTQLKYYNVSVNPSNWYQWFDPNQPNDDGLWQNVSDIFFFIL